MAGFGGKGAIRLMARLSGLGLGCLLLANCSGGFGRIPSARKASTQRGFWKCDLLAWMDMPTMCKAPRILLIGQSWLRCRQRTALSSSSNPQWGSGGDISEAWSSSEGAVSLVVKLRPSENRQRAGAPFSPSRLARGERTGERGPFISEV